MAKKYNLVPNIWRARVTETVGELVLELAGEEEKVPAGIEFLQKAGVSVEPAEGNVFI
jgi:hypothetical protein